jgi:hypothetical protein
MKVQGIARDTLRPRLPATQANVRGPALTSTAGIHHDGLG